jgi:hypothetical protein
MTINRLNQDVTYLPAFRNLLNNGAMQVAQRGTSVTGITTGGYLTVDRWSFLTFSQGTWTQSVENDAPTGSGFRKSVKVLCTTADAAPAASDRIIFNQSIEGQNLQSICKGTANAQQLTMSFWVKSNVTGTYIAELFDNDNSRHVSAAYTVNSSATWEKKTIVFPADTTGALDNDNAQSMQIIWFLGAGSDRTSGTLQTSWGALNNANRAVGQTNLAAATNNYWQVTGVQLEVGAVATPFEFKPIEQELAECQRYYFRTKADSNEYAFSMASCNTTTSATGYITFPVTMRSKPTALEQSGTAGDYRMNHANTVSTCSAVPAFNSVTNQHLGAVDYTFSTVLTAGRAGIVFSASGANGFLGWSAEL